MSWTEAEYVTYLEGERHLFAWCLERYGGVLREAADVVVLVQSDTRPIGGMSGHELLQRTAVELTARGPQLSGEALGLFEHVVGN